MRRIIKWCVSMRNNHRHKAKWADSKRVAAWRPNPPSLQRIALTPDTMKLLRLLWRPHTRSVLTAKSILRLERYSALRFSQRSKLYAASECSFPPLKKWSKWSESASRPSGTGFITIYRAVTLELTATPPRTTFINTQHNRFPVKTIVTVTRLDHAVMYQ